MCGPVDAAGGHVCSNVFPDPTAYPDTESLRALFDRERMHRVGYIRLVLLVPLDLRLVPFPVVVLGTCNRFRKEHVRAEWEQIASVWDSHGLVKGLGPIVGNGSDGDSRRRSSQLAVALADSDGVFTSGPAPVPDGHSTEPYRGVDDDSFVLSARAIRNGEGELVVVVALMVQDLM